MIVAKAKHHDAWSCYGEYITIGKKQFSPSTLVKMWNEVPDEIRKKIQDKYEGDF